MHPCHPPFSHNPPHTQFGKIECVRLRTDPSIHTHNQSNQVGDQLAVEKVTKQLATVRAYQRGDVVVFNPTQVRPSVRFKFLFSV